jgi:hypothetical protein
MLMTYRQVVGNLSRFDGQDLSNEAMTAYALQFFTDLAVGNSFVDSTLIN